MAATVERNNRYCVVYTYVDEDERLRLALNLAFSCSLRLGEMLGLTWDCVDITPESIESGSTHIFINKDIQRVNRKTLSTLENKDVTTIFPASSAKTSTLQVLKTPKTESSIRKIFLPKTVAEMLVSWKAKQEEDIRMLGGRIQKLQSGVCGSFGNADRRDGDPACHEETH